jgi:hypothetical protein
MSLQDLLTKDYSKKPQPIVLRLMIISGNLLIFLYLSGFYVKDSLGPMIKKAKDGKQEESVEITMNRFSTLDMVAIMLALMVTVYQLDFRRPDIDSFNEIVYLPAQESRPTFILLLFTIFKLIYQLPDKKTGIIGWSNFFLAPILKLNKTLREPHLIYKDEYLYEEKEIVAFNCILVLSTAFCLWHSFSFKYEIRNTEKNMILKSLNIGNIITGMVVIYLLVTVIFIEDTKYLGILLLVVIVIDIFRIVKKAYLDSRKTAFSFELRDYIHSVKLITIFVFGIVLHGSLGAFALEKLGFRKDSSVYRAASFFFLFYRNDQSKGTVSIH